jgi:hypothetical protein
MNFRNFIKEYEDGKFRAVCDANDLVLFFIKDKIIYASPEDGRLAFARMKSGEEDTTFIGFDMEKAMKGIKSMSVFGKKDIKKIKVISKEEAEEKLPKPTKTTKLDGDTGIEIKELK